MQQITGTVVKGKGEARGTGYPTANIAYVSQEAVEQGVWTCRVVMEDGSAHHGLAVIGMWELAEGLPSVEVHMLDFTQDLYGEGLAVTLLIKLRDLMAFETTDTLVAQIKKDIQDARNVFGI